MEKAEVPMGWGGGVKTLFTAFSSPLWMHCPHLVCFLPSLPKTRKGPTRESPLRHPLGAEIGCGCHRQEGELVVRDIAALPPPHPWLVWDAPLCGLGKQHHKDRVCLAFS